MSKLMKERGYQEEKVENYKASRLGNATLRKRTFVLYKQGGTVADHGEAKREKAKALLPLADTRALFEELERRAGHLDDASVDVASRNIKRLAQAFEKEKRKREAHEPVAKKPAKRRARPTPESS